MESITNIEQREELKQKAVDLRESGHLAESVTIFSDVISWDKTNANFRGAVDVLGHLRTAYSRLADNASLLTEKIDYLKKAASALEEASNLLDTHPEIPQGSKAILKVHQASTILSFATLEKGPNFVEELNVALATINQGIDSLPGSKAHKAWPCLTKSRILYELGRKDEALETLSKGEIWLYEGYDEEMQNPDQGELKLKVWHSGILLGRAEIFSKENKPKLALHYAQAIISIDDPNNQLVERKKDASKIIEGIK